MPQRIAFAFAFWENVWVLQLTIPLETLGVQSVEE